MANNIDTTINATEQLYSLSQRVLRLERKDDEYKKLTTKITRQTDENIAFRRDLNDMLYNLDSDNIPMLNTIIKYQDDYATTIAEIRMKVDSQGASIISLVQFQQAVETAGYINSSQVEAIITASVNEYGGTINSYLQGNYYTQTEVNNELITIDNTITNSITQSITQSGGTINSYLMGNFADQNSLTLISQSVTKNAADISLVVQNNQVRAGVIVSAINNDSSVVINANRISLAGKNIDLTSENITISSSYFNVDRFGNLTAASGTFSGTVNATGGNISGSLFFGGNLNYFFDGNGYYRIFMHNNENQYFYVTQEGKMIAAGAELWGVTARSISVLGVFDGLEKGFIQGGATGVNIGSNAGNISIFTMSSASDIEFQSAGRLYLNSNNGTGQIVIGGSDANSTVNIWGRVFINGVQRY